MDKMILLFCLLFGPALSDPVFENSTNICERCQCIQDVSEFTLDCKNQSIVNTLANWPPHNKTFIATFSYNNITTLKMLPTSDLLLEVVFDHCGIANLENGVFEAVKNVQFVDLSYNLLTTEEISPEKFKGPYNNSKFEPIAIKHLNLAYNKIHSLSHNLFEHMQDLEELNLEGNDFRVLDLNTQTGLSTLTKLERLNLANNKLTELTADSVRSLSNLVELNLAFNNLDFVPASLTLIGDHLEILNLDNNPIFELTDDSFLGISAIMELSLNNLDIRFSYVHANAFAPLKENLRILKLSHNRNLIAIDSNAFGDNQVLEELYLNNNSLNMVDYNLTKWSKLRIFQLEDNPLECDCNLYNISQDLSLDIRRNKDGAICMHPITGKSTQMYDLTRDICNYTPKALIHHIARHFETIRIILLTVSILLTVTTIFAVAIAYLRYRRFKMNQNYSFASQVLYNPLNTSYIRQ